MSNPAHSPAHIARRESLLFAICLLFGIGILPVTIYAIGKAIFGEYGGGYLGDFFAHLLESMAAFDLVVWFLVFSPYLVIQGTRATVRVFRMLRR
ncbi:MAG: hypothetical protein AAGA44_16590 [Pseudomonadota bacterium]